ncbi:MAG: glycerate kinase [Leptolyngbyaceae cyanobacterium SL_7_1]|nr:glycerate kinase [Leptolyngbyaceae cyanobacterium SL_7_1]
MPVDQSEDLQRQLLCEPQASAFGITPETVTATVETRSQLLVKLYPALQQFCQQQLQWQQVPLTTAWLLWLPLAEWMAAARSPLQRPMIQGILGGQGTGKTTLAAIEAVILESLGYRVARLSLDDLYKTYAERSILQQSDPRLRWRGPPGTHDVALGIQVLQEIRAGRATELPRFDKSAWGGAGDRTTPAPIPPIDILLFEGWFVGVSPIDPAAFESAPLPIVTDADRAFAYDSNTRLQSYLPLWELLDRLIVLYPHDYRFSQHWRRQAEQGMIATGRSGMADVEVDEFVTYFWRSLHPDLFIMPLLQNSNRADLIIELDAEHNPISIRKP